MREYEIEGPLYFIHPLFHTMFDVVIPLGPNDVKHFGQQLEHTRKYVIGYRRIYIVAFDPGLAASCVASSTESSGASSEDSVNGASSYDSVNGASSTESSDDGDSVIVVPESAFPFSKNTVSVYHGTNSRNGWYFQQLLKMYAWAYLDGLLDRYLVVDADTFFVNPTRFETTDGKCLYNFAREYNPPYFEHMARLSPIFTRTYELSGICHHMLFETGVVKEIIGQVEAAHKGKRFWEVFLECVDVGLRHGIGSGASEYELYFHYIMKTRLDEVEIRELVWDNVTEWTPDKWVEHDYVAWHHYDQ